jgi:uroporphyrinogen decarboxylase
MTSRERVMKTIKGEPTDRTPIYGWVSANLREEIGERHGSVAAFEDKYEFDAAHIFGAPTPYQNKQILKSIQERYEEFTPDVLLEDKDFYTPASQQSWDRVKRDLEHHKQRGRFCYVQSPGFFEFFNTVFGIQNHLMYLILYKDELAELYSRQADWLLEYVDCCLELGIDCIHISDDWGSQRDLMFNPELWRELVKPNLKRVIDYVHSKGALISLHSDGCIKSVTDDLAEMGIDMVHPWQESAGMSYDTYLEKYSDKFALLGGVCIQTTLGIVPQDKLESEIRRVFGLLKGKRWICCTSHYVQKHCSMDDLDFAFDLIYRLAREQ